MKKLLTFVLLITDNIIYSMWRCDMYFIFTVGQKNLLFKGYADTQDEIAKIIDKEKLSAAVNRGDLFVVEGDITKYTAKVAYDFVSSSDDELKDKLARKQNELELAQKKS